MASDGKQLEALVAFVESKLLPEGFRVQTNLCVRNDDGIQIAELDIEVRGKVGSTSIAWLIECRDRPSDGPAPSSWIEQLVGRRLRFGFNKVTAVSTTGFAAGAKEFARSQGIELREVKALEPEAFDGWLQLRHIRHVERLTRLDHAEVRVPEDESEQRRAALLDAISNAVGDEPFLVSSKSGLAISAPAAFSNAVAGNESLFQDLQPNGPGRPITLIAQYPEDDHFVVETAVGVVPIREIAFVGELAIRETLVPLSVTAEYRHDDDGKMIAQVAQFSPQTIAGMKFAVELHHIAETGCTHAVLRRLKDDA